MRSGLLRALFLSSVLFIAHTGVATSQVHAWRRYFAGSGLTIGINPLNPGTLYADGSSGEIYVSYDKGKTWNPRGSPGLPDVRQIIVHPSDTMLVFAVGFSGGLRRSTDAGVTWNSALPNFGIDGESVTFDLQRPDTMVAGNFGDGRVYRSTDRGETWTLQGTPGTDMCSIALRPDSTNVLYAGTGNGTISKTTDGGKTWRRVKAGGSEEIPKIVIHPANPMVAYAAAYEGPENAVGVWKTTDGGEQWFFTSLRGISVWSLDICRTDPNTLYAGSFTDSRAAVFRTSDGGATWDTLRTGFPPDGNAWSLKIHPLDSSIIWLALTSMRRGGIYSWVASRARIQGLVRDNGTNEVVTNGFAQLQSTGEILQLGVTGGHYAFDYFEGDSLHAGIHVEAFPYYIHNEPLAFILDSAVSRDIRLQQLPLTSISGSTRAASNGLPVQATVTAEMTTSIGSSSRSVKTNSSGEFLLDSLYISYLPIIRYEGVFVDPVFPFAQKTFAPVQLDSTGLVIQPRLAPADVLITSSAGSGEYARYYTAALDSAGISSHVWDVVQQGSAPLGRSRELLKHAVIYYTGTDTAALPPAELDSLAECMNLRCNLFVTGENFVEKNQSSAFVRTYVGVRHGGNMATPFCKGSAGDLLDGIRFTTSGGTGANDQTSRDVLLIENPLARPIAEYGPPDSGGIAGVRIDSTGAGGKLALFGFGFEAVNTAAARLMLMQRIIGYFDGSITVGVEEGLPRSLPSQFSLSQNFPNPSNPTSTIRYAVPRTAFVRLSVYDVLGREVVRLVNENRRAGSYDVVFHGDGLASGVYLYRMDAGGFAQTRKLLLIR